MSIAAREALADRVIFDNPCQREDILSPTRTQTQLIALLLKLVNKGHFIQLTAVRCDHSDDSALGEHSHANGWCADFWFLKAFVRDDWMDADDPRFAQGLLDLRESGGQDDPMLHQIGLAGSAWTPANAAAAGPTAFHDDGADHVHVGAQ